MLKLIFNKIYKMLVKEDNTAVENITINNEEVEKLYAKEAALRNNVIEDIHKDDFIFDVIKIHFKDELKKAVDHYFDDGDRSAKMLTDLINNHLNISKNQPISLFEFASGYGCVTRHLRKYLIDSDITSCDIHQQAIQFIEGTLGMKAVLSDTVPEKLSIPDKNYDVVFALSFFSHMPKQTWSRWVDALLSKVNNDGILIFTTHGLVSKQFFDKYYPGSAIDSDGFLFASGSEQHDLKTSDYGQTLTLPSFVQNALTELGAEVVEFKEGFWWGHQDLYVVKK